MKTKDWRQLLVTMLYTFAAAFIGSAATYSQVRTWYAALAKPVWNPPNWLFGPVWTTLYILMAVACWLVWRKGLKHKEVRRAVWLYGIQLIVNAAWSVVFFGLHSVSGAFMVIIVLLALIVALVNAFHPISKAAAWLLVPYLFWVTFASFLNLQIMVLNP